MKTLNNIHIQTFDVIDKDKIQVTLKIEHQNGHSESTKTVDRCINQRDTVRRILEVTDEMILDYEEDGTLYQ